MLGIGAGVTGMVATSTYDEYLRLEERNGLVDEERLRSAEAFGSVSIGLVAAAAVAGGAAAVLFLWPGDSEAP
jgi:hypothetical protein